MIMAELPNVMSGGGVLIKDLLNPRDVSKYPWELNKVSKPRDFRTNVVLNSFENIIIWLLFYPLPTSSHLY